MGLDFLEFTLTIEKKHHMLYEPKGANPELMKTRTEVRNWCNLHVGSDWKAGIFYDCIRNHFYRECSCGKPEKRYVEETICRRCGRPLEPSELTWEQFCDALCEVTGKKRIERDMWLRKDLNFF